MRLDSYLFQNGYYSSRTKASQAVDSGEVLVDGKLVKPSYDVKGLEKIEIVKPQEFVSLGGYKLKKAIDDFEFFVKDKVFADIGASTGGFTDCLLKRGAKKVYAIDVGENQLDISLKNDERVVVLDRTNARFIDENTLSEKVDGAVIDCSFISLKNVLFPACKCLKEDGTIIALIKPQFECGKKSLSSNGIVTSKKERIRACVEIYDYILSLNLVPKKITTSPIVKGKNVEYLIMITRCGEPFKKEELASLIN